MTCPAPNALGGQTAEVIDLVRIVKPELRILSGNLPAAAEALRDILARSNRFFERGVPVRTVRQCGADLPSVVELSKSMVVREAHRLCQPMKMDRNGQWVSTTLTDRLAQMYLEMVGEWNLRPLAGITTSPLLSEDGNLRAVEGYDPETSLWCTRIPELNLPPRPAQAQAEEAMRTIRHAFRTFPFADSPRRIDECLGIEVVDVWRSPGRDESAFLIALVTACCRTSLQLAPGLLVVAPAVSGAGAGKGLLVRAICTVAFGVPPGAVTTGNDRQELDKRIAAELVEARPTLFLDNVNNFAVRSDILASVMTERSARVRILGQTRMTHLNSSAFIAITGNGLSVTEDLARRFLCCDLDARCEDPESRPFPPGFLDGIEARRAELLTSVLTVWRWGRQNVSNLTKGKALGSYETWAEWCRDPLLTLGCRDPVERIEVLKARDVGRQQIAELFATWSDEHGEKPVKATDLSEAVKAVADPQGRGRQFLASYLGRLAGTNAAGFTLERLEGSGKWSPAIFRLRKVRADELENHRGHRGHRGTSAESAACMAPNLDPVTPMTPMTPMPHGTQDVSVAPGEEAKL